MSIVEARKIDIASGVLSTLTNRGISIDDRIDILNLALKSLKAKKRSQQCRGI
jgi:hypothetical protein